MQKLFAFLKDLKVNNNRDWFEANKERYQHDLREPLLALIEEFAPYLERISPHFLCDAGSLFRIYRDMRFSPDKTPYKTHAAIQFRHEAGKDVHAPGFYLHLEPGEVFIAGGIWHPESETLARMRTSIDSYPKRWKEATKGLELGGASLKRAPKGYCEDHPLIEDLRRKDIITSRKVKHSELNATDLAAHFGKVAPLCEWICKALDVPW
jgi:uncharacterized protein (TIGR02453 family)